MTNENNSKGIGLLSVLQIIFAVCYYTDPCKADSHKECNTLIAKWEPWEVWMPTIISAGLSVLFITTKVIIKCTEKKNNIDTKEPFFYNIEQLSSSH